MAPVSVVPMTARVGPAEKQMQTSRVMPDMMLAWPWPTAKGTLRPVKETDMAQPGPQGAPVELVGMVLPDWAGGGAAAGGGAGRVGWWCWGGRGGCGWGWWRGWSVGWETAGGGVDGDGDVGGGFFDDADDDGGGGWVGVGGGGGEVVGFLGEGGGG